MHESWQVLPTSHKIKIDTPKLDYEQSIIFLRNSKASKPCKHENFFSQ